MPPDPRISVVVPHLDQPELLAGCLASLAGQEAAPPFEVLVVDNGSAAPPFEVCARFGATFLAEPVPGPGPARSRGAAAARGDILAFIDADGRADPGWLAAIAARFAAGGADVLGGDVRIAVEDPARPTVIEAYESVYGYRMRLYVERDGYVATCNMAAPRAVFAAVGPFAGIATAEDMDWGRRARALGYRLAYAPEMRVSTPARGDFAELARKWDRHLAHFFEESRRRPLAGPRWWLRTALVAASPLVEAPYIWRSDRLDRHADRWRALRGVARIRLYRSRQMLRLALGADPAELSRGWRGAGPAAGARPRPEA
jgi:glycosyltransferase involved in cell wall biosynthesis